MVQNGLHAYNSLVLPNYPGDISLLIRCGTSPAYMRDICGISPGYLLIILGVTWGLILCLILKKLYNVRFIYWPGFTAVEVK
jgi:hypothetical protein